MSRAVTTSHPQMPLIRLTSLARGGGLWLLISVVLALRPGRLRAGARDGVLAVALASATAHLLGHVLPRRRPAGTGCPRT
jgi:hypothetical protein